MDRRRQWGIVSSVLVLSALLAVASSQSPSPGAAAPQASSRPVAPSPARRVPSFPPGASPTPKRASRPAAAPAPAPRPRPATPSPPAASPRPKPPSQPAVSPAPRPRPPSGPAPAPARKPSSPPAASPVPKLPTPPTASPAPKPAPAAPVQKPSPSPAPKPSPPTTPPPAPKLSAPVTVTPPPSHPPTPAPSPPTTQPPAPKQSAPLAPPPSSHPAPAPAPANSTPPASSLAQLSPSFYALSCPSVELAVNDVVRSASTLDPTIPGKLLRMVFHDCFVEGCDASVLIAGNGTERTDPANLSLGGFNVIDEAKRLLEAVCPATVSCSDIVVLAARDAVTFTGGPAVPVSLGRRDSLVSLATNVRANIIDTGFSIDAMAASFASKGLTLDDLVTLSGGHTIGSAHCGTFRERFRPDANGSMVPVDGSMNTEYANQLIRACSAGGTTVDCDEGSASAFDNRYYGNLLDGRGLLRTDAVLVQNATTRAKVAAFAQSQDSFFRSWADSFARLTTLGVKTGADGEIRRFCSSVNG